LDKISEYYNFLLRFASFEEKIRNIVDERYSLIAQLKALTQKNSLKEFEGQGVALILHIRNFTLRIFGMV